MGKRQFNETEVPFEVCPYMYCKCLILDKQMCRFIINAHKAKDMAGFLNSVKKTPNCKHAGEKLTPAQWENRRIGVPA